MHTFDYEIVYSKILTPDIVALTSQIHEFRGEQTLFIEAKKDTLVGLVEIAKIQSTEASNKIEGIYTSDERLKKLVMDKTMPKSRNEKEIAGYRDVLATIHEDFDYIYIRPSYLLQLHRNLYRYSGVSIGGNFKNQDNVIAEVTSNGTSDVRFQPVPAWQAADAIDKLCAAYDKAQQNPEIDTLLVMPMFILDFLCIHPFNDGNGRMSRLLTLLLLYRSGYIVGKYISIEKLIENTKESYYEALQESSVGWHESENDYLPFMRYLLGIIVAAYREFSDRVEVLAMKGFSRKERIRAVIQRHLGKITKAEILELCPDISQITVQRTLLDLQKSGEILKIGGGRYTSYVWNGDKSL